MSSSPLVPLANIINHLGSSAHSLAHDLPHPYKPQSRWKSHHTEPKLLSLKTDTFQSRKRIRLYTTHGAPSSSNRTHCQPTWPFSGPAEDQQSSARSACAVPHLRGRKGPGTLESRLKGRTDFTNIYGWSCSISRGNLPGISTDTEDEEVVVPGPLDKSCNCHWASPSWNQCRLVSFKACRTCS